MYRGEYQDRPYGPRVIRRGGRGGGGGGPPARRQHYEDEFPRSRGGRDYKEDVAPLENDGGYTEPPRNRYPRMLHPGGNRGGFRRGGRRGARSQNYEGDTDEGGAETRRGRRRRPRGSGTAYGDKSGDKSGADSAREHSEIETGDENEHKAEGHEEEKKAAKGEGRGGRGRRKPRPPQSHLERRAARVKRASLPKIYTAEEYLKFLEPVDAAVKKIGDKKGPEDEEVAEATKDLVKYIEQLEGDNPYEVALKMLILAVGADDCPPLKGVILKALDLVLRGEDVKGGELTPEVQDKAYVLSRSPEYKDVLDVYQALFEIKDIQGDKRKHCVQQLLKYFMFVEALNEVFNYDLEKEFTFEEVVVPLLIQHKVYPVDEMLKKNTYYLEPMVRYLDKVIGLSYNDMIAEVERFDSPFVVGLGRQFLMRLILNWHELYKFSLEWCPNVIDFFCKTHLYYLNRRRFRRLDLPYANWLELVEDLIHDDPSLPIALVDELVRYRQNAEAKYFANRYNVKKEDMADPVIYALDETTDEFDIEKMKAEPLKPREGRDVYICACEELTQDQIKFVDKPEDCSGAFDHLIQKPKFGIAVEWKPENGLHPSYVTVLQIAAADVVYVFDIQALKASPDSFVDGLKRLMDNSEVVKVGFNLGRTIDLLEKALGREIQFGDAQRLVDLRILQDKFYKGEVDYLFPNANRKDFKRRAYGTYELRHVRGLNSLARAVFGKGVDRSELISNWDIRPLRPAQLKFAVMDASVLIEMYDKVSEIAEKNEKNLEELIKLQPNERGHGHGHGHASSGEDKGDETGEDSGDKTGGEESGRSSRAEDSRRRGPPRFGAVFGGGRFGGFLRGRRGGGGGRFRGGGRGGFYRGPGKLRVRNYEYPPASQKEEILDNGKVPEIMSSPKKPKDLKIVADSMLHGLGKALIEKGFDVVTLRREDRHTDCIKHYENDKRVILTQGRIFYELKDQVVPGYCLKVLSRHVNEQVDEVLKAYQVEFEEEAEGKENDGGGTEDKAVEVDGN